MSGAPSSPLADDAASPAHYSDNEHDGMGDNDDIKHGRSGSSDGSPSAHHAVGSGEEKPKSSAKDPLRPRRKKARRACYACQRAHLTCGDERPCQRCIKRGLQDACQDGVRKKAKYLHDAPTEALMPGAGNLYHPMNGQPQTDAAMSAQPIGQSGGYFSAPRTPTYDVYAQDTIASSSQMPPPPLHTGSFSAQSTPISPHFGGGSGQQTSGLVGGSPSGQVTLPQMQQYGNPIFDPSDPGIFNFDLASLNFANNYGALEFGMLGHMSSGAADTPPESGMIGTMNQGNYNPAMSNYSDVFVQDRIIGPDWQQARQSSAGQLLHTPQATTSSNPLEMAGRHESLGTQPHAYAIGAGPSSLASASPASLGHDAGNHDGGPMSPAIFSQQEAQQHVVQQTHQQAQQQNYARTASVSFPRSSITLNTLGNQSAIFRKRRRNSSVYSSVTQPYPYTAGFHSLTAFLQKRFSTTKKMRIAKALASIRPSFISVTGTLNRDDLIFMEQSFQRTLEEYEDFITALGCPTIICRRTGEVAAVSKEFCLLTGWTRNILLGKDPNHNINTGHQPGESDSGSNSRGASTGGGNNTPRLNPIDAARDETRSQPVFIAELLDDDSVVHFYEDFARLAFSDSHGRAQRPCKLLKYRTKEEAFQAEEVITTQRFANGSASGSSASTKINGGDSSGHGHKQLHSAKIDHTISGEGGFNALGGKEGKVDCMMCWSVKRDLFEVPMMIIVNFLPCI